MSGISEVGKFQHPIKLIAILLLWFFSLYTAFHVIKNFEKPSFAETSRPAISKERTVFQLDSPDSKQRKLVQLETQTPVKHNGVCRSPECIQLAHQLHNWRDISVDPCQDFYKAACGKYNEHTLAKGPRLKKKTLVLINLVQAFLQDKLPSESKSENSIRLFYRKCRKERHGNQEEIFVKTAHEIFELLMKVGVPPILDTNWDESKFNLNEMMLKMANLGWTDFGFFGIFVEYSREVRIAKTVPTFTDAQAIGEEFFGFAANNGIDLDQEVLKKDAEDMMKLTLEILEFNDSSQGLSPLQPERIPSIDIEKIVKALMNPSRDQKTWEKIRSRIVVDQMSYFFNTTHNLETIIQKTSKRTLANFLALQIIKTIHDDSVGRYSPFVDDCAATTVLTFPLAALRIFVRNHFDKENLQIASEMVEDIRESLLETFEESTWLQDDTKKGAIRKLKMMKKVIGYPEEFEVPGALDAFFEPLDLSENDSYFITVIKTAKFKMQLHLDFVASLLPIKSIFGYVGANASYRPLENLLTINVAFLDDPFFDSTFPKYAKIASIGGIIGHEIGHGFDSIGRKLDENGQQFDWWTPENSEEFSGRAQCLADQYSNYDDPDFGRNLNGNWTIREIAADIIGVNVSWRTYQKVDFAKEPSIFGFEDERPDKLFFHLTALNWCRGRETNSLAAQKKQVHPTSSFRVNGVFSNMKSFGEAFNCPVGSPMNPKKNYPGYQERQLINPISIDKTVDPAFTASPALLQWETFKLFSLCKKMSEKDTATKSHHPMKTVTIVLIWIFALYAALLIVKNHEKPQTPSTPSRPVLEPVKHKGVCKSPECITLAQNLHNWRDVSVDPCQDFYKAACGKYTEHTLSPGSRMVKKSYILKQLINEFLLKDEQSTSKSENAMKIYYKRCAEDKVMNETRKNEIKKDYLLKMIQEVGSFPMLTKNWTEADFDLNGILVRMGKFSGGFKLGILRSSLLVKPFRFLVLPGDPISTEVLSEVLEDFLFSWINKLGIGSTKKQQVEDVKAVLELSRQLQEFDNNSTEMRSLSDFEAHMPSLNLEKIFKSFFDPKNTEKVWEKIKPMIRIPHHPLFFNGTRNLETIIQSTPKRTLANYLFISFIDNLSNHWEGEESKNRDCTEKVMNDLPLASVRVFTRNHFDKENLAVASEMVEEIQESFAETIRGSTWLSEPTKMAALRKLDSMKKIIGYPKEFEVPGALDSYFDTLSLADKSSFYAAKIEIERFNEELLMSYIASVLTVLPLFHYVVSNAMYIQHDNSITLNVAILSDPFLDSTYPKYAKMASIGAVVGHEMGHGYDPEGRRFDENGDQNDRWTPEDAAEYDRRTQCLIDQYNNYDDPDFGRNLNGSATIKEIASDIIGTDVSWKSYNKVDFANEPSIFGFEDEKPDKLFFHLTALNWCSPRSTVTLAEQLKREHPTNNFRVNGVFQNMKSFADAFNCPVGSPMNPEKKCELF